jgi:hypothetical protein
MLMRPLQAAGGTKIHAWLLPAVKWTHQEIIITMKHSSSCTAGLE